MSTNDNLEPKEDKIIIHPFEPDLTKGFTSSTPPPKPQTQIPQDFPKPKEKK